MARIPYHETGLVWHEPHDGTPSYLDKQEMLLLNSQSNTQVIGTWNDDNPSRITVVFDRLYDLTGLEIALDEEHENTGFNKPWEVFTSADTTDGQDGTWTSALTGSLIDGDQGITRALSFVASNVKGVRYWQDDDPSYAFYLKRLHVLGSPVAASGDVLAIWHPTADSEMADGGLDFTTWAGGVFEKDFRIKNVSGALTANNVTVSVSGPRLGASDGDTQTRILEAEVGVNDTFTPTTKTFTYTSPDGMDGIANYLRGGGRVGEVINDVGLGSQSSGSSVDGIEGSYSKHIDDANGAYIQWDFGPGVSVTPTHLAFRSSQTFGDNWRIEGTPDGTTWTVFYTGPAAGGSWSSYELTNVVTCRWIRIIRVDSDNEVVVYEVEVWGTVSDGRASSVTIPSLAAGAISDVLTLRITKPAAPELGMYDLSVRAEVASWT